VIAFDDGATMVELAPLGSPGLVPMALAAALNVRVPASADALAAIARQYESAGAPIVLDNCEHVLEASRTTVQKLIGLCPGLRFLATSREPLRVPGEIVVRVPQLGLPASGEALTRESLLRSDAARLFVTRAMNARGGFKLDSAQTALVADIVRKLDGLPLAIELAAASAGVMDLTEIAARLDQRLSLPAGGAEGHHRTLRATMDWSYDLLEMPQQVVFASLAVFRGGWTLEAAESVINSRRALTRASAAELLTRLFEKSLISVESTESGVRYSMLETVREYALDRLGEAVWAPETRRRHAEWCLALAEAADEALKTREQLAWLTRLDAEHANMWAALNWAIDEARDAEIAARLIGAKRVFWQRRGHLREGAEITSRALALAGVGALASRTRGGLLLCAGMCAFFQARYRDARANIEAALDAFGKAGDLSGQANALIGLAQIAMYHDEYALAETYAQQALGHWTAVGDTWGIATAHSTRGYAVGRMASTDANTAAMGEAFIRAVEGFEACGDRFGLGAALNGLGGAALHTESHAEAEGYYQRSIRIHRELEDEEWVSRGLNNLGICARGRGDIPRALAYFEEVLEIRQRIGALFGIATLQYNVGDAVAALGDHTQALIRMRESVRLNLGYNDLHGMAQALAGIAAIWLDEGERAGVAARLLAFSAPHLGYPGPIAGGSEHLELENLIAHARAALGDEVFAVEWAAGAALDAASAAALGFS